MDVSLLSPFRPVIANGVMVNHSSNSLEIPLLLNAFFSYPFKPKSPDTCWLMDNLIVHGHYFFMQKRHSAQPDLF